MKKVGDEVESILDVIEFPSDEECARRRKAYRDEERQRYIADCKYYWEKTCPPLMKGTDPLRLEQESLSKVMDFADNPRGKGMVIHGVSGAGKTRALWLLLKRLSEQGVRYRYWQARKLADTLATSFKRNQHEDIMHRLQTIPVLVIDDLGKERGTERWETDLFDTVNTRTEYDRPIIVTTNLKSDDLIERYNDKELAEALIRRVFEFCTTVAFKRTENTK